MIFRPEIGKKNVKSGRAKLTEWNTGPAGRKSDSCARVSQTVPGPASSVDLVKYYLTGCLWRENLPYIRDCVYYLIEASLTAQSSL